MLAKKAVARAAGKRGLRVSVDAAALNSVLIKMAGELRHSTGSARIYRDPLGDRLP